MRLAQRSGCSCQKRRQKRQQCTPHALVPLRPCSRSPRHVHLAEHAPLVWPQKVSLHSAVACSALLLELHGLRSCALECRREPERSLQQRLGILG